MKYKYIKHCTRVRGHSIKKGDYIVLGEMPCKVESLLDGGNDLDNFSIKCVDIFTDSEYNTNISLNEIIYSPKITINKYIVVDIIMMNNTDLDGVVITVDCNGKNNKKILPIPSLCEKDKSLAVYIIDGFYNINKEKSNSRLHVVTLCAMGKENIKKMYIIP